MLSFPAKLAGERRFASMDFTAQLANVGKNITLAGSPAPAVTAAVFSGADDPDPELVLDSFPITSGNVVGQWIKGGVVGTTYLLTWTVSFSDGSIVERQRTFAVVADSN